MAFDPKKPVVTHNGFEARIICTDKEGEGGPIVALIRLENGGEISRTFTIDGVWFRGHRMRDHDLVNIPEKGYINIWVEREKGEVLICCSNKAAHTAEEAEKLAASFPEGDYLQVALEVDLSND